MKKGIPLLLAAVCVIALAGCSGESQLDSQTTGFSVSMAEFFSAPSESGLQEEMLQQDTSATSAESSLTPTESSVSTAGPSSTPSGTGISSEKQHTLPPAASPAPAESKPPEQPKEENTMPAVNIQVGNKNFTATLYDNDTARALLEKLPLTLNMDELNGNEKFFFFSEKFPANSERVRNIKAGDLMLYGSDCLVLFYKSFSTSYSYTRLGYMEDAARLAEALGNGSTEVTFSTVG